MVSYAADIRPLFRSDDVDCMSLYGVLLDNYGYMSDPAGNDQFADHANARTVHFRLTPAAGDSRMPDGGPYWPDSRIALYQQWMDDGFEP